MISGITAELEWLVKFARCLPIPSLQAALTIQRRLDKYGHQAIQNLKQHVSSPSKTGNLSGACIFTRIIDPAKNSELSDYEIEHEASNLIVAGSDTTAVSLTYLVWALLHPSHRQAREKLEAELTALPGDPTNAQLAKLPYLGAVLKEGLRLYGAAPGSLPRVVPAEGAILARFQFPGGVIVSTQAYSLHRDPKIFDHPER
jgi:cytochrome P450